jgi:hypothetical protein
MSYVWWCTPVPIILALGRLRNKCKFQARLGYIARSCLKNKQAKQNTSFSFSLCQLESPEKQVPRENRHAGDLLGTPVCKGQRREGAGVVGQQT